MAPSTACPCRALSTNGFRPTSRPGSELRRILKPGGVVQLHMLTADRSLGDAPVRLPGPAAAVQFVPVLCDVLSVFTAAGFAKVETVFLAQNPCFQIDGCELRETRIEATR
jgi:hypothetical protein